MTPTTYDRFLYQRITRDLAVPAPVRHMFADLSPVDTREEMMFREVVARRVYDAVGITGEAPRRSYAHDLMVRNARTWLRYGEDRDVLMELGDVPVGPWIGEVLAVPPNFLHSSTTAEFCWTTAAGQVMNIRDMTNTHLTNTIKMLRRLAPARLEHDIQELVGCGDMVIGDVASDSFDMELDILMDTDPLEHLETVEPRYLRMLAVAVERRLPVGWYFNETMAYSQNLGDTNDPDYEDIPF